MPNVICKAALMSESFSILVCKFPNKYIYIVTESKQFSAKLNLLVTKISTTTKTDNKMWWAPNRHRVWYRLNNELLTLETNHKLKIDTFLVCMCFISLPVFIFCSRFSLCCLLNESALRWFGSDGSQHIFPAKKTSNLIPYNMKYESKITRRQGNNEARI